MQIKWPDFSDKPIFSFLIFLLMLAASLAMLSGCTSNDQNANQQEQVAGDANYQSPDSQANIQDQQPTSPQYGPDQGNPPSYGPNMGGQGYPADRNGTMPGYQGNRTRGNYTGGPGMNMTEEQRQQFMQQGINACQGKSESDSCTMQTPRGETNGTCRSFNGELSCTPAIGGGPRGNSMGPQ